MSNAYVLIKELKQTWDILLSHYLLWILAAVVDLSYYILFSLSLYKFYENIAFHVQAIAFALGTQVQSLKEVSQETLAATLQNQDQLLYHYTSIAYYVGLIAGSILLLWLIFQGINWYIAHRINEHKVNLKRYVFRFCCTTLAGTLLIILVLFLSVRASMFILKSPIPLFDPAIINWISVIFFLWVMYLVFATYGVLHKTSLKKHHKQLIKLGHIKFAAYIISLAFILVSNLILWKLVFISFLGTVLFGLLITLPLYTFCRVYIIRVMKH